DAALLEEQLAVQLAEGGLERIGDQRHLLRADGQPPVLIEVERRLDDHHRRQLRRQQVRHLDRGVHGPLVADLQGSTSSASPGSVSSNAATTSGSPSTLVGGSELG